MMGSGLARCAEAIEERAGFVGAEGVGDQEIDEGATEDSGKEPEGEGEQIALPQIAGASAKEGEDRI